MYINIRITCNIKLPKRLYYPKSNDIDIILLREKRVSDLRVVRLHWH